MKLVNASGTAVATYTYDAWGNVLSATGTLASVNPLRYRGYYYDEETKLYYLQSRYYDPAIGRFINADGYVSSGQGFVGCNMFAYCNNNPVIFSDPSGELVSVDILDIWTSGNGEDMYFDEKSNISKKLKKSRIIKGIINAEIEKMENGEEYGSGTVTFTSEEPDLWLGIRAASYTMTISKETRERGFWFLKHNESRYVVDVIIYDTYNFNFGSETGDGIGSILNNIGFYAQEMGLGTEYKWEAYFKYETKWKR